MQPRKFRILSAITAGSLAVAVVAITASSGTSQTAKHAALAAQTESFPPVNLDDCPTLHTGYPTGGCVAQLQTDLKVVQDNNLDVDGNFGSADSQTYKAVTTFQTAHGLKPDGMVGPATKQALAAALSGSSVPTPVPEPLPPTPTPTPAPPTTPSSASVWSTPVFIPGSLTNTIYFNQAQTDYFDSDESQACELFASLTPIPAVGEIGDVIAAGCEVQWKVVELQASRATDRGMCLKIKFTTWPALVWWPDIYHGKYCN